MKVVAALNQEKAVKVRLKLYRVVSGGAGLGALAGVGVLHAAPLPPAHRHQLLRQLLHLLLQAPLPLRRQPPAQPHPHHAGLPSAQQQ